MNKETFNAAMEFVSELLRSGSSGGARLPTKIEFEASFCNDGTPISSLKLHNDGVSVEHYIDSI